MNPFVLGAAQNISDKLRNMDLNDLNIDLNLYQFYTRFRVADRTFHAYHYGEKLKSASYYAYLIEFNVFEKILFIAHYQREILCICQLYKNVNKFCYHMDSFNIPNKIRYVLSNISPYMLLKKCRVAVFDSRKFTHYALVKKTKKIFYGVVIQNNYEHD